MYVYTLICICTDMDFGQRLVQQHAHLQRDQRDLGKGIYYTQFAIQDSRLFGPNPWKVLAPPSNYLSKKVSGQPNPWNKSW